MVMPQGQALGGLGREGAETLPHPLSEGFQGFETGAALGGMNADAFQGTVIHGKEDSRLTFGGGKSRGHIRAPHLVDPGGGDSAVMDSGSRAASPALRRQQLVFPHQPQHPPFGGPDPGIPQSGPDLTIDFPMKGAGGEGGFEVRHKVMIGTGPYRPWPLRRLAPLMPTLPIEGGALKTPYPA